MMLTQSLTSHALIFVISRWVLSIVHFLHEFSPYCNGIIKLFPLLVVGFPHELCGKVHFHGHKLNLMCIIKVTNFKVSMQSVKFALNLTLTLNMGKPWLIVTLNRFLPPNGPNLCCVDVVGMIGGVNILNKYANWLKISLNCFWSTSLIINYIMLTLGLI